MRIRTIDFLRGIAISAMLFIHIQRNWLVLEDWWFVGISYLITLPVVVNEFLFVAGISFGYSWIKDQTALLPCRERYLKSISRTLVICIFSTAYNAIAVIVHGYGWRNLWFWYILQSIWICRLFGLIVANWSSKFKILIVMVSLGLGYFIWFGLDQIQGYSIVVDDIYFILFNPIGQDSLVFYFGFFLLGTLIGEKFFQFSIKSPELIKQNLRQWRIGGTILISFGILIGWPLSSQEIGWHLIEYLNTSPNIEISALPWILIIQSPAWAYFTIGCELLLATFLYWRIDVNHSNPVLPTNQGPQIDAHLLVIFGKYSLTIYLLHYLLFFIPLQVGILVLLLFEILIFGMIYVILLGIERYTKSRLSFEYLVELTAKYLLRLFHLNEKSS